MRKAFPMSRKQQQPISMLGRMVEMLNSQLQSNQIVTPAVAKAAISLESLSDDQTNQLSIAEDNLSTALESIIGELNVKGSTDAQLQAATVAGILSGDFRSTLAAKKEFQAVSTENMAVVQATGLSDVFDKRSFGLEAYDERENRNAVVYSIAYNYQSARQDAFGEAFFPTLSLTPDNVGFGVTVNLMMVYDGTERKVTGTFEDYKKRNIIRAVADHTVLKKEQTAVIPVHRAQSADKFVAAGDVPPAAVMLEGESIVTAPLAFGKKLDLIGIGATEALLASGIMDQTDSLDPTITLKHVYAKVGANVIRFYTEQVPLSNFTYSVQNNYRGMNIQFTTNSILLNNASKNLDGSALAGDLALIVSGNMIVRVEMVVTGSINIETGETALYGNSMSVYNIRDAATGNELDLTAGDAKTVADAIAAGALIGYDLRAYRTNMNRRQRGQLIDQTKFTQLYNVPLRSPITAQHPINTDGQTDASDVQALVTTTRIRTCNEAVTQLLQAAATLGAYVDSRDEVGMGPDVLGVGRFFVRAAFARETLDMNAVVDSIKSHERALDLQAALVGKIRDMAYRLYRDSEYKAAADALAGGEAPKPTVVIGTDPVLARYLTVSGDLRTLGDSFDVKVVETLDVRMQGKIVFAFSTFDENRNVAPNPLNFGNMVWAPEMVLTANISRNGGISKESVVQPRYLFVVHTPIMGMLDVVNVPDMFTKKVPVNMHTVP